MQLQRPGRQSSYASACDRYHDGMRRDLINLTLIKWPSCHSNEKSHSIRKHYTSNSMSARNCARFLTLWSCALGVDIEAAGLALPAQVMKIADKFKAIQAAIDGDESDEDFAFHCVISL